jgi:DNA-binding CsgD family transcriptional regulator
VNGCFVAIRKGDTMPSATSALMSSGASRSLPHRPPLAVAAQFDPALDGDRPLARAARPVVDQLEEDLAGARMNIVVTDIGGRRVVDVRVLDPKMNECREGLAESAPLTTARASIFDSRSGRLLGTIDLIGPAAESTRVMRALATRAARDIEERLLDEAGVSERLVLQRFLQERRRAKGPLVLVTEHTILANAAAARLIDSDDEPILRQRGTRMLHASDGDASKVVLSDGSVVRVSCEPVYDGDRWMAAVLRLTPCTSGRGRGTQPHPSRPGFGWGSLTETERAVMELVTDGLTNQEAAERLFLSRHTVGFHLRSIFRKVGVNSRVDLTRMVTARGTSGFQRAMAT